MNLALLFQRHANGQSVFRIVATIGAIVLATAMLLATVSLGQGWMAQQQKRNIVQTFFAANSKVGSTGASSGNLVYLSVRESDFNAKAISEVGVEKTNPADELPAGLTTIPTNSEVWVTPALQRLIDANPSLRERYAEYQVRTLFPSDLAPSPDSLMALYRLTGAAVTNPESNIRAVSVPQFWSLYDKQKAQDTRESTIMQTALTLAGVIMITPILLLVLEVSRIGIAQREKRYAVLSLIGATTSQMRLLVLVDALPSVVVGVMAGLALFILGIIPALSTLSIAGESFWVHDLVLPAGAYAILAVVIIVCAGGASLESLRRVHVSPLEVSRTSGDVKQPSVFSLLPLIVCSGALWFVSTFGKQWYKDNTEVGGMLIAGLLLGVIVGIFVGGPYTIKVFSYVMTRLSRGASSVIATHRLRSTSRKAFHSLSGIVIALFVGTLLVTLLATVQSTYDKQYASMPKTTLGDLSPLQVPWQIMITPSTTGTRITSVIATVRADEEISTLTTQGYVQKEYQGNGAYDDADRKQGRYYQSCKELAERTTLTCPREIDAEQPFIVSLQFVTKADGTATLEPRFTAVHPADGTLSDSGYVLVARDAEGFARIVDKVNTLASQYYFATGNNVTVEYGKSTAINPSVVIRGASGTVLALLIMTMLVGGLSIFVSIVGGIFERRKMYIRLRLVGATTATFVRSLFMEIFIPLAVLTVGIVALGVACSYWILVAMGALDDGAISFAVPGVYFWLGILAAVLLCSLLSLLSAPLLSRLTNLDEIRSE